MKGMVFTEFLELVEARYSPEFVEDLIDAAALPSRGVYTATGTYPHREMIALVDALHRKTGVPVKDLMLLYGEYLFSRFLFLYPGFFGSGQTPFGFFAEVETYIHKEVRKLYPEAALPTFIIESHTPREFSMVYVSSRPFADLCEGLIRGCLKHFGASGDIRRTDLSVSPETRVRFEITLAEAL